MNGVAKLVHDDGLTADGKGGYGQKRIMAMTPSNDFYTHIILLGKVSDGRSSLVAYPCSEDGTQLSERYIKVIKRVGLDTFLNHIGYRFAAPKPTRTAHVEERNRLTSHIESVTYTITPPLEIDGKNIPRIRVTFEKRPQCASVTHAYDASLPPSKAETLPYISGIGWTNPSQALSAFGITEERPDVENHPSCTNDEETSDDVEDAVDADMPEEIDDNYDAEAEPRRQVPMPALVQELARQGERISDLEDMSGSDEQWVTPMDPMTDERELTAWTRARVYFAVLDGNELQFDSVPRNPLSHINASPKNEGTEQ